MSAELLTREQVRAALPVNMRVNATQEFTDKLNGIVNDPIIAEHMREHFITYAGVLTEGKWSMDSYMNAIQYATYKMLGMTNKDAYMHTFPSRHQELMARGATAQELSAYVAQYHKTKLVNAILERAMIPVHVLYQDVYHKAIQVNADLMVNAQSEKVRQEAANSILTHLAKPKEAAPAVAIVTGANAELDALRNSLAEIARTQTQLLEDGVTAKDIAGQKLIAEVPEAEYSEVAMD